MVRLLRIHYTCEKHNVNLWTLPAVIVSDEDRDARTERQLKQDLAELCDDVVVEVQDL